MMLSEIIAYKNYLEEMTPINGVLVAYNQLSPLLDSVKVNSTQFPHLTDNLEKDYKNIVDNINHFENTIDNVKNEVTQLIRQTEPNYYAESWRLYSYEMINDSIESILNRTLSLTEEARRFISGRVSLQGNWQHAGMIINPGHEEWINHLVGHDPLYLVAQQQNLLEPAILRFNDQYQRRLRSYIVTESIDNPILHQLPDKQFGYCLAFNFFNYKPLEIIKQYLIEIYNKLKPGGVIAFTFNNCDRAAGAKLVERKFMCYTPWREILSYAQSIGFQMHHQYQVDEGCFWAEFRRPGTLNSLRGGQSLAKVIDIADTDKYTEEEIKNIRQQAEELKIYNPNGNTPRVVEHIPISQLVKLIKQRKTQE